MKSLKIGTRGSDLALAQSLILQTALSRIYPKLSMDTVIVRTQADMRLDTPLGVDSPFDKGAFTKELETALLRKRIHVAVHSLKDLPVEDVPGLVVGAILPRASCEDFLISKQDGGLEALPRGGYVATGSQRRKSQILRHRPDLVVEGIRGNVATRLSKLARTSRLCAIIVARAGLERLYALVPGGLCEKLGLHAQALKDFLPAPGQGAIAVQVLEKDERTRQLLTPVHDPTTEECVRAERLLLKKLGGGCHSALGALAQPLAGAIYLQAAWFQGTFFRYAQATASNAEEVATQVFSTFSSR
ncbi:Porphobilinogen deaminase [Candidatus Xiphinematobacter sp. Idaho Grape]|uniref:hydroxymethylbilane synthase n=1 Tax=Candidatus Xiphinematobacter sp. Idaho Grape TaxID=1704307 RepID=UPI00070699DA|nr:hydroxymethylbilane synthase [Candidatus Xiphinematobacter sp. Idaho Grape]ALJ57006.1 Porphobilinogen deaminase [Candidatus Xiphinematobacter sp. Idaho Grape]